MKKEQQYLQEQLQTYYSSGEAKAIARMVFETRFHYTLMDYCLGKDREFSEEERTDFENIVSRLLEKEPVQYVLGQAEFCGLTLGVEPGVLIPRPETEELVQWVASDATAPGRHRILDLGTGSGCIALALSSLLPGARVSACDVSEAALAVARKNALKLQLSVTFFYENILEPVLLSGPEVWDIWVSNPPYICFREQSEMSGNVCDYEPHSALFVPDDDPLLFYRAIARLGRKSLCEGGLLYFEINRAYGLQVVQMLEQEGYRSIELRTDMFGNDRMIKCVR